MLNNRLIKIIFDFTPKTRAKIFDAIVGGKCFFSKTALKSFKVLNPVTLNAV